MTCFDVTAPDFVCSYGQLFEVRLSTSEFHDALPLWERENETLRDAIACKEMEIKKMRADLSEAEEERSQLLEKSETVTRENQRVLRNTESIDGEIIKCIQTQHALDCVLAAFQGDYEKACIEVEQELTTAHNELLREVQLFEEGKEQIFDCERGIDSLCKKKQNRAQKTKEFEKISRKQIESLEKCAEMHSELAGRVDYLDIHTMVEGFQVSSRQANSEFGHSLQVFEST